MSRATINRIVKSHIELLAQDNDFIDACVVVTTDGHLVAGVQKKGYSLDRLAAIGSTVMALGDSLANEVNMNTCKDVIAEMDEGIVVFMHMTKTVAIASISNSTRSLGMLLSSTRNCVDNVLRELKAASQKSDNEEMTDGNIG